MKPTDRRHKVILLFGPTGVGKTALLSSLNNAGERFAVITADSMQVYRGMDIGSAKATEAERNRIRHYLLDIRDPFQQFNVADFISEADSCVSQIESNGLVPVISGGTAYYFKHYIYGLSSAPQSDAGIRAKVAERLKTEGPDALWNELLKSDPVTASKISRNDIYRVTRAIEVLTQTGRPLSSFPVSTIPRAGIVPLLIWLDRPKAELDERIRSRVDQMYRDGLENEIAALKASGAAADWPGMKGIGYREFFDPDLKTPSEIRERIVRDSIQYAKRQKTFFKTLPDVHRFDLSETAPSSVQELIDSFLSSG